MKISCWSDEISCKILTLPNNFPSNYCKLFFLSCFCFQNAHLCHKGIAASVTRLVDLLHFGQLFIACGINYFGQIVHINCPKVSKSILFLVKSFLGNFYRHLAVFSGHTACCHKVRVSLYIARGVPFFKAAIAKGHRRFSSSRAWPKNLRSLFYLNDHSTYLLCTAIWSSFYNHEVVGSNLASDSGHEGFQYILLLGNIWVWQRNKICLWVWILLWILDTKAFNTYLWRKISVYDSVTIWIHAPHYLGMWSWFSHTLVIPFWISFLYLWPLFSLFLSYQTNTTIFTTNICEKCPSRDSNPQPSDC